MKKRQAILRWTCTAALALVLVACLLTMRFIGYAHYYPTERQVAAAVVSRGVLSLSYRSEASALIRDVSENVGFGRHGFRRPRWEFQVIHETGQDRYWLAISIPLWFPALLLAVPTVLLWRSHLRSRHVARLNLCPKCRYSLTDLPPGAPCPECGKDAAGPKP